MDFDTIKHRITEFFNLTRQEKKSQLNRLILFLGVLGILLIGLSECGTGTETPEAQCIAASPSISGTTAEMLEQQLLQILEKMEGVGNAEIMITLEDSGENYYATEDKTEGNSESSYASDGTLSNIRSSRSLEQEYLLVENSDGRREALLLSRSEPQVKGVIVICDGADRATVRETVTEAVCTILHINSTRVYVAKAKAEK